MALFDITWETYAYFWEIMFVVVILASMKATIMERIYGIQFKKWIEIDTGRSGYTILDKSLDKCKIKGQIKTVHRPNILHGWLYFKNDNCENLKMEEGTNSYYCNSEEFDTVYKNKLFEQLMLLMQKNLIYLVIILVVIAILIGAYDAYILNQNSEILKYMVGKIAEVEANYGTTVQ